MFFTHLCRQPLATFLSFFRFFPAAGNERSAPAVKHTVKFEFCLLRQVISNVISELNMPFKKGVTFVSAKD